MLQDNVDEFKKESPAKISRLVKKYKEGIEERKKVKDFKIESIQKKYFVVDTLNKPIERRQFKFEALSSVKIEYKHWKNFANEVIYFLDTFANILNFTVIFVISKPNKGKTYSLRNLPEDKTIIFNGDAKELSFPGSAKKYGKRIDPKKNHKKIEYLSEILDYGIAMDKCNLISKEERYLIVNAYSDIVQETGREEITLIGKKLEKWKPEGFATHAVYCDITNNKEKALEIGSKFFFILRNTEHHLARLHERFFKGKRWFKNDIYSVIKEIEEHEDDEYEEDLNDDSQYEDIEKV